MSRIRTIKPEFFTSDTVGELSRDARLLFIGLWCLADKEGRLKDKPKWIKVQIFPYDNLEVDDILRELDEAKFILRYEAEGEKYIQIANFVKHQRPHPKESESLIPSPFPVKNNGKKRKETANNGEPLKETASCVGREGNGVEEGNGDGMHGPCIPNTQLPASPSQEKNSRLCDSEYLESLQASEAYADLNVKAVYAKMVEWCRLKGKVPTRNRFLGWLNREDRPMQTNGHTATADIGPYR